MQKHFVFLLVFILTLSGVAGATSVSGNVQPEINVVVKSHTQSEVDVSITFDLGEYVVKDGDYFIISVEGLKDPPEEIDLGSGVLAIYQDGGYRVDISSYKGNNEVKGSLKLRGSIDDNSHLIINDEIIIENSENSPGQHGDSDTDVRDRDALTKHGSPIQIDENGKKYIDWSVSFGSYNNPVVDKFLIDTVGEGLELDVDSAYIYYIDEGVAGGESSTTTKLKEINRDDFYTNRVGLNKITDKGFELNIPHTGHTEHTGKGYTFVVKYKTFITDQSLNSYNNSVQIGEKTLNEVITWDYSGNITGVSPEKEDGDTPPKPEEEKDIEETPKPDSPEKEPEKELEEVPKDNDKPENPPKRPEPVEPTPEPTFPIVPDEEIGENIVPPIPKPPIVEEILDEHVSDGGEDITTEEDVGSEEEVDDIIIEETPKEESVKEKESIESKDKPKVDHKEEQALDKGKQNKKHDGETDAPLGKELPKTGEERSWLYVYRYHIIALLGVLLIVWGFGMDIQ